MKAIVVSKSKLLGKVKVAGAKNSALALLPATLLTDDEVVLKNFPAELLDAQVQLEMLSALGKKITMDGDSTITIRKGGFSNTDLLWEGRSIRNTLLILGALTAKYGSAKVPLPGGCKLGERKFDIHINVLEALGASVWEEGEYLCAKVKNRLVGADITLPIRSTGATQNAILLASLAEGTTRVWAPHIRPEILDLIDLIRSMGACVKVYGQEHIEIKGVKRLSGADHQVIPDNMEAITWLVAAVMTDGAVEIENFPFDHLEVVLAHLRSAGARLYKGEKSLIVQGGECYPIEISTGPHPGINSDVQPILAAWATKALGESRIVDLRFPGRYGYADEMAKMGVASRVSDGMLSIFGRGGDLKGAEVTALDLRAGAALALCGLSAEGETIIHDAWQVERGYSDFVGKLKMLGANVRELD